MSNYEERTEPNASPSIAAAELGTPTTIASAGKIDLVKNTYLVSSDQLPNQFKLLLYSLTRQDVVNNRMRFRTALNKNILSLLRAINGRDQNLMIKIDQVEHGIAVQPEPVPERPNILEKALGAEKAKEYERYQQRKELGLE